MVGPDKYWPYWNSIRISTSSSIFAVKWRTQERYKWNNIDIQECQYYNRSTEPYKWLRATNGIQFSNTWRKSEFPKADEARSNGNSVTSCVWWFQLESSHDLASGSQLVQKDFYSKRESQKCIQQHGQRLFAKSEPHTKARQHLSLPTTKCLSFYQLQDLAIQPV